MGRGITSTRVGVRVLAACAAVSAVLFTALYLYLSHRSERIFLDSMRIQARALFKQVVITRRWVADHGGVFVEKLPWVSTNAYLTNSTIEAGGKSFIKENPARVTRELSEYARGSGAFWFRITSLKLVNPLNAPDDFERAALMDFDDKRAAEVHGPAVLQGSHVYRYMAPLYVEAECLACHSRHGYRLGEVRGGISVTIPLEEHYALLKRERYVTTALILLATGLMVSALYLLLNGMVIAPLRRLRDFAAAWDREAGIAVADPAGCGPPAKQGPMAGDEIAALEQTLRRLHCMISRTHVEMEERVAEATSQLRMANIELARLSDHHRATSRMKSEFIAALSHELRTPLTSSKGAVSYLKERFRQEGADPELTQFAEILERNIDRFAGLVEATLDLEKIEAGQIEFHRAPCDMARLIAEAADEALPMASERAVELKVEAEPGLPLVDTDGDRVRQALMNLLTNAIRHSPGGGLVRIECYVSGRLMIVRVIDQGPGLGSDLQRKVFERFFKESKGGTGLGLTISKGIIEGLGGEIGVDSDGRAGSAFYFKLPLSAEG